MSLVGVTLAGRYILERQIGQGGTADVYRAKDTLLDRLVSVKVLNSDAAADAGFRRRLKEEAKSASALAHAGIVRILDAGEESVALPGGTSQTHAFIVMEFVQGIELTKVIAKGPLKVAEALRIAKEVADALAYAHRHHIIHRDITPSNIMVTKDGAVKVLDFGIALSNTETDSEATQALAIVGTPAYFAPEQADGNVADERSDIYSLGIVLFEMLTGRLPFTNASAVDVARAHLDDSPPAPSSLNAKVPLRVDMVVERALSKSPSSRFTTAQAFADDIESAYIDIAGSPMHDSRSAVVDASNSTPAPAPFASATPAATQPASQLLSATTALTTHSTVDDFDALFAPSGGFTNGQSWSVEEMSGYGVKSSPQRKRVWGGISIAIVTVTVLALVALWVVNLAPGNFVPSFGVEVPSVANLTYDQAATKLKNLNFQPIRSDENSATVAKDKVIRTEPKAGTKIGSGDLVTIFVSLGALEVSAPNLAGMTLADGQAQLTALKFISGSVTETYHGTYPAGTIISTDPVAGTALKEGATINFVVANGKVDVPDVRGMSLSDATNKLSSPEFMIPVVTTGDKSCKSDASLTVASQTVVGEAPVGTSVTLYYCAG